MLIIEQIKQDQVKARKAKDKPLVATLTTLYAEAAQKGFDDGKRLSTNAEVTATCKKFVSNVNDTLKLIEAAEYPNADQRYALETERSLYENIFQLS